VSLSWFRLGAAFSAETWRSSPAAGYFAIICYVGGQLAADINICSESVGPQFKRLMAAT
jgi:hypothetical protein